MNLSKKLNLNYTSSAALYSEADYCVKRFPNQPHTYYDRFLEIADKQDRGEEVSDKEYASLPNGKGTCNSAEHGYFMVNFHYQFFKPDLIEDIEKFEQQFYDYLKQIEENPSNDVYKYIDSLSTMKLNIGNPYMFFLREKYRDKHPEAKNGSGYYELNYSLLTNLEKNIFDYLHSHNFVV